MQEKKISHKHKTIYYRVIGEGPVVVLLHGVPFDGTMWKNQFDAFPGYKLIIPDLPGSGRSEIIEDMSMEGMAECVRDIIVHETGSLYFKSGEPHSAIVIGHSMGGYIALALAEKHPEVLNGLGLFHSTAYADSEERKGARLKTIKIVEEKGVAEWVNSSLPNLFSPLSKKESPQMIDEQMANAHNFQAETIVYYQTAMMKRPDRRDVLKKASVPVLFVLGKYDPVVPLKDGMEQSSLADLNYIHVLENASHVGMIEEATETNTILENYITNTHIHPR